MLLLLLETRKSVVWKLNGTGANIWFSAVCFLAKFLIVTFCCSCYGGCLLSCSVCFVLSVSISKRVVWENTLGGPTFSIVVLGEGTLWPLLKFL
jgi:hypothetical protein